MARAKNEFKQGNIITRTETVLYVNVKVYDDGVIRDLTLEVPEKTILTRKELQKYTNYIVLDVSENFSTHTFKYTCTLKDFRSLCIEKGKVEEL